MTKNMAFRFIDGLFIVVFGANGPTDQEWLRYIRLVEYHGLKRTMQLVFTDGGGPDYSQRSYFAEIMCDRFAFVAVVSSSIRARALVTVISWFNPRIRVFSHSKQGCLRSEHALRSALAYLEIPASRHDDIDTMRRLLRSEITAADARDDEGSRTL